MFLPDTRNGDELSTEPCSNDTQCRRRHANPLMKCLSGKCEEEKCKNNSVCPMDALCIKGHCIDVGLVRFVGPGRGRGAAVGSAVADVGGVVDGLVVVGGVGGTFCPRSKYYDEGLVRITLRFP